MKTTILNTTAPLNYLSGFADAKLREAETLDTVCSSLIPNYNIERFEAIAIRVYLGKETTLTVYALDKNHKGSEMSSKSKIPVKKFKLQIKMEDFVAKFSNINFTISTGHFDLDEIEVVNK